MKTIITICIGLLVAGCAGYDWSAFGQALGEYGRQQQEIANQRNLQLQENAREINRQLQRNQNSTYWQERRAQQEWQENFRKQYLNFPKTDLFPFSH